MKGKLVLVGFLSVLGLVVWLNIDPPQLQTVNPTTVPSGDRAKVEKHNFDTNTNSTEPGSHLGTTVCFVSVKINTSGLNVTVSYDFINGKPWNGTLDGKGCYQFNGVAGVSYVVAVTYTYPSFGLVKTSVDVVTGQSETVSLDKACC